MRPKCAGLRLEEVDARVERAELHLKGADEHLKVADGHEEVATRQVDKPRGHVDSARGCWKRAVLRGGGVEVRVAQADRCGFQTIGWVPNGVDTLLSMVDMGRGKRSGLKTECV